MNSESPSIEAQKHAIARKRSAQFEMLLSSGIISKVISQSEQPITDRYNESLPVILGSEHKDSLCLFVGLELVALSEKRTKYILIGTKTRIFIPNNLLGFNEADCELIESLYIDLKDFKVREAPNYDMETGAFLDGN